MFPSLTCEGALGFSECLQQAGLFQDEGDLALNCSSGELSSGAKEEAVHRVNGLACGNVGG